MTEQEPKKEIDLAKCDCRLELTSGEIHCKVADTELFAEITRSRPRKINFDLVLHQETDKPREVK